VGWVRRYLLHPRALFRHVCIVPSGTPSLAWDLGHSAASRTKSFR
jgi:hypothetical protein